VNVGNTDKQFFADSGPSFLRRPETPTAGDLITASGDAGENPSTPARPTAAALHVFSAPEVFTVDS
jgi:hypothetical protein